jgi:hypothetical protein
MRMRSWAYKSSVADGVSHEKALVHASKYHRESSQGDEYACLYDRARKCGATHDQAAEHADACIRARVKAHEYAEADWTLERAVTQSKRHVPSDVYSQLERIERALERPCGHFGLGRHTP